MYTDRVRSLGETRWLERIVIFWSVIPGTYRNSFIYIRRVLMGDERHFGLLPQFVVIVNGGHLQGRASVRSRNSIQWNILLFARWKTREINKTKPSKNKSEILRTVLQWREGSVLYVYLYNMLATHDIYIWVCVCVRRGSKILFRGIS